MSTMLRIGPRDHGREMTYDEFLSGDYEEGFRYELIRGELYVSPQPSPPHDWLGEYLDELLTAYKMRHRKILKRLSSHARVFVPGIRKTTCLEPDFALQRCCGQPRAEALGRVQPFYRDRTIWREGFNGCRAARRGCLATVDRLGWRPSASTARSSPSSRRRLRSPTASGQDSPCPARPWKSGPTTA